MSPWTRLGRVVWIGLLVTGCNARSGQQTPGAERVGQLEYLEALRDARPGLMRQFDNSVADPAWRALVMAPRFREALLDQPYSTAAGIVAAEYTRVDEARDRRWAAEMVQFVRNVTAPVGIEPFVMGQDVNVGYRVGEEGPVTDPDGFTYKSFFGFHDFESSIGPAGLHDIARALVDGGFEGAIKVNLRPSAMRFHYHQLILYASSPRMGACGEELVRHAVGDGLRHVARGIDAPPGYSEGVRTDWHHLLLRGGHERLPARVLHHVGFDASGWGVPCSGGSP